MSNNNKNFKSGLIVLIIIIVISLLTVFVNIFTKPKTINFPADNLENPLNFRKFARNSKYIAALYVEGTIEKENSTYNQDWLLSSINYLKNDPNNVATALYINSPGGAVYQADEVYLALQDYKTSGKFLYSYFGEMAASGGYYIACPSDLICANRNTLTGSIGVISGTSFDVSEFLENLGIYSETIHSGKNKNMMNYNEPFTDEQRQIMQTVSDECYEQFTSIVSNCRNIPIKKVYEIADGRIYTAKQALDLDLIDRIDTFENMIELLEVQLQSYEDLPVIDFKYEEQINLFDFVTNFTKSSDSLNEKIINSIFKEEVFSSYPAYIYQGIYR